MGGGEERTVLSYFKYLKAFPVEKELSLLGMAPKDKARAKGGILVPGGRQS